MKLAHGSCLVAASIGGWFVAIAPVPAFALLPTQVFDKVSASVWVVRALDASERPFSQGSAVVFAPGKLITNCHVLVKAVTVQVRRENVTFDAKLEHADAGRDLCILQVSRFDAPAVEMAQMNALRVGQRVYAVGTPRGMEATLSEGLISGLRTVFDNPRLEKVSSEVIQTTAPISPGSSGGGLFDEEGRLVGITSFVLLNAQSINYALPADWISAVPERAQAALARRSASRTAASPGASPVPPGYPVPGTSWTYTFVERQYTQRKIDVIVNVLSVNGNIVEEAVIPAGSQASRRVVNTAEMQLLELPLHASAVLIEPTPYLPAAASGEELDIAVPAGYPTGGFAPWVSRVQVGGWENLKVPGGTFKALRLDISGRRQQPPSYGTVSVRYTLTVWYSPDIRRLVRLEHRVWSNGGRQIGDDVLELLSYRPPS